MQKQPSKNERHRAAPHRPDDETSLALFSQAGRHGALVLAFKISPLFLQKQPEKLSPAFCKWIC